MLGSGTYLYWTFLRITLPFLRITFLRITFLRITFLRITYLIPVPCVESYRGLGAWIETKGIVI